MKYERESVAPIVIAILFIVFVSILLMSCNPPRVPFCTTTCGLTVTQPFPKLGPTYYGQPQWSCAELERTEREIMKAYAGVTDDRFRLACARVRGWDLGVSPEVVFDNPIYGRVSGLTYCDLRSVWVNNASPMQSTLVHELAHVVQECRGLGPFTPGESAGHANWGRDGILRAIQTVSEIGNNDYRRCFDAGYYVGPRDGGVCQ